MSDDILGIDLGTTYSAVARIDEFGKPVILTNIDDEPTTPSVVLFESDSNYIVGSTAKQSAITDSENTVALIKRHMGEEWPLTYHGQEFTPESISALILEKLVKDAVASAGVDTKRVIITVPAYFGSNEKNATRQAGEIAGLDVVDIVAEPVAAALSYGIKQAAGEDKTILVYDLGGGTFDTTILRITEKELDVVVIDGDRELGGADWDEVLIKHLIDRFVEQAGDEAAAEDEAFAQDVALKAEELKKQLTKRESKSLPLNYGTSTASIAVTRDEFEAMTSHLLDRTMTKVDATLEAAREKQPDLVIDEVLLVGGSSYMPAVARTLKERYGWDAKLADPNQSVAKGAAIYGAESKHDAGPGGGGERPELAGTRTIRTVIPKGIGIQFQRRESEELYVGFVIHKNEGLPFETEVQAVTASEGQTGIAVKVFEQNSEVESEDLTSNKELTPDGGAVGSLSGLPPLPKGSLIKITVRIDEQGQAHVSALEPNSGKSLEFPVTLGVMQQDDVDKATARHAELVLNND